MDRIRRSARGTALVFVFALLTMFAAAPVASAQTANPFVNIPVSGYALPANPDGTVIVGSAVQAFSGTLTITEFKQEKGHLVAVGTLTVPGQPAPIPVEWPVASLDVSGGSTADAVVAQQQQEACEILSLDLGPLNLDLLGLVVDLQLVQLDITAVPGPGNLLGNLLCMIAGLLDQGALGPAANRLNQIISTVGGA
jgi:hypothetical protein